MENEEEKGREKKKESKKRVRKECVLKSEEREKGGE